VVADNQSPSFLRANTIKLQLALGQGGLSLLRGQATPFFLLQLVGVTALITNQDRLLEVIRQKQAELIRMNTSVSAEPSSLP
jgi:hypothetical protein